MRIRRADKFVGSKIIDRMKEMSKSPNVRPELTIRVLHNINKDINIVGTYPNHLKFNVLYSIDYRDLPKGIYIVKQTTIKKWKSKGLINYYMDIPVLDHDFSDSILSTLSTLTKDTIVETYGYVSYNSLLEYDYIIDDMSNIMFNINVPDIIYPDITEATHDIAPNEFKVTIYTNDVNKRFFTNVFNSVIEVMTVRTSGYERVECIYNFKGDKKVLLRTLDEISSIGIYTTYNEALSHNDMASYVDKLKYETQVYGYKTQQHSHEHDMKMRKLEYSLKSILAKATIEEKRLMLQTLLVKYETEVEKGRTLDKKARLEVASNTTKEIGFVSDIVRTGVSLLSKII